jgi:hypothetical protein
MVAFHSIINCAAVAYSAVKLFCTCKDINHCLVTIFDIGEGGVVWRIKEGILNAEYMGEGEGEEIGSTPVAARETMRTKDCLEFFTVSSSNFGNISTNYDLGLIWDLLED